MPAQLVIHSGTVNLIACDIDGYAFPAIQVLGDTQACTVTITDSVLGASRYDTNGTRLQTSAVILQDSQSHQVLPDLATLTVTRTAFDPAVEAAGGKSLSVGTSVLDQLTTSDLSFNGAIGSPSEVIFEDFPTLTGVAIPSSESFTPGTITLVNRLAGSPIPSGEAFPLGVVVYAQRFTGTPIPSDEAFSRGGVGLVGQLFGLPIPSSEAFTAGQITLANHLAGTAIPSSESFTPGRIIRMLAGVAIASSESFTPGAIRIVNNLIGSPIPSSEAFGVGAIGVETLLSGAPIPSSESFAAGNIHAFVPGADQLPALIAPGRVQPDGDVIEGTPLVASVGSWANFPAAARFVWLADDVVVQDDGLQEDVWISTYIPTTSDVGKTITVRESTGNNIGESSSVLSRALIDVHALPPAFVGHDEVFGPMPTLAAACVALRDTIRLWLATYLRERERRSGRAYGALPSLRGWRIFTESLDAEPGDQFPLLVIVAPGIPDAPVLGANGILRARYEMGASIIVNGPDFDSTLALAGEYGAALRGVLAQHGSLGGVADATLILGERYDQIASESARTIMAAEVVVSVRLGGGVALRGGGPSEPSADPLPPDDGGPILGTVATTELDLERV